MRNIADKVRDAAIGRAIIDLGDRLQMEITAEGVETPEQLKILRVLGCDDLFSKAMPAAVIESLLPAAQGDEAAPMIAVTLIAV